LAALIATSRSTSSAQYDVFVSYSHLDRELAREIREHLEHHNHRVWMDQRIEGGQRFTEEIANEIDASRGLVLLASADACASEWVHLEVEFAVLRGKPVLTLLCEPDAFENLPPRLVFLIGTSQHVEIPLGAPRERVSFVLPDLLRFVDRLVSSAPIPIDRRALGIRFVLVPPGRSSRANVAHHYYLAETPLSCSQWLAVMSGVSRASESTRRAAVDLSRREIERFLTEANTHLTDPLVRMVSPSSEELIHAAELGGSAQIESTGTIDGPTLRSRGPCALGLYDMYGVVRQLCQINDSYWGVFGWAYDQGRPLFPFAVSEVGGETKAANIGFRPALRLAR
jgi:hypothetical protein